jgi:hypothetical protein
MELAQVQIHLEPTGIIETIACPESILVLHYRFWSLCHVSCLAHQGCIYGILAHP